MLREQVFPTPPPVAKPTALRLAAELLKDERSVGDAFDPCVAVGRYIVERVLPEMADGVFNRIIPHGAAELSHALFLGHAFAPYGYTLRPLEPKDGVDVHGPKDKALEIEKG